VKGLNIAILVALIAFVIAIVSLGMEFFGVFAMGLHVLDFPNSFPLIQFSNPFSLGLSTIFG